MARRCLVTEKYEGMASWRELALLEAGENSDTVVLYWRRVKWRVHAGALYAKSLCGMACESGNCICIIHTPCVICVRGNQAAYRRHHAYK